MKYISLYFLFFAIAFQACSPAGGENKGHEFMPDMVHSTAVEANLYNYYYYNTWGTEEDYKKTVTPRKPVKGTVARGMTSVSYQTNEASRYKTLAGFEGMDNQTQRAVSPNGSVPYYYDDSEAERVKASQEIINNPFPITKNGLERGKNLYDINCGICHGVVGDGAGYLVRDPNPATGDKGGVYPAAPANFLLPQFVDTTNGLYYHAIMYGKNVMGAYTDKLSYEERWQVIHYIRALQAKERKVKYDAETNTLNSVDKPYALVASSVEKAMMDHSDVKGESGSHDAHGTNEHIDDEHGENGHGDESHDDVNHNNGEEDGHNHDDDHNHN